MDYEIKKHIIIEGNRGVVEAFHRID